MSYPDTKSYTHWYPIKLFKDAKAAKEYQCRICEQIPCPELASTHSKCGSTFCLSCILSWLFAGNTCPTCKQSFEPISNIDAASKNNNNKVLINKHKELQMTCPWHKDCGWIGKMGEIMEHKMRTMPVERYVITVEKVVPKKCKKTGKSLRKVRRKSID